MARPILKITDGTAEGTVDLISMRGWSLDEWSPAVPEAKGGGVFRDSPLVDGRKLAYRKMTNITDTFNLVGSSSDQDGLILTIQKLQRILEKAITYWTSGWQNEPVWIEARGSCETETRYAVIVDYRLTGFGSPYRQPFFNAANNVATEAVLVIEHSIWQETEPGADGTCAQASSRYYSAEVATYSSATFEPGASDHDGTFQEYSPTLLVGADLTNNNIGVGFQNVLSGKCAAGILFSNVTVPQNARVTKATLTLTAGVVSIGTMSLIVKGQSICEGVDAAVFSTQKDFWDRYRTSASYTEYLADGVYPGAMDVTAIVEEIITVRGDCSGLGWASGDDMGFFLSTDIGDGGGREFCAWDNGSDEPQLYIEWADTGEYLGQEATCSHEVMVSNKMNKSVITNVYYYDDSEASYSTNLLTSIPPYSILPNGAFTPAVNDIIYFGSDTSHADGGPFDNIVFDLLSAQTGIVSGLWQYYSGAAWTNFDVTGGQYNELCGDAQLFAREGVCSIVFEPQTTWAAVQVTDGVDNDTGFWVRFKVTAVDGVTSAPIQQNRHIYTTINPYIDIDADQVPGDVPALSRIMFDSCACWARSMNTIVLGLRSLSRGENFSAYLNASTQSNPSGVRFGYNSGESVSLVAINSAPGYYAVDTTGLTSINPGTGESEWVNVCSWLIGGNLPEEYIGVYHAYVRCEFVAGAQGVVRFRMRSVFGEEYNVSYSDENAVSLGSNICAIDLGQLIIQPSNVMRSGDRIEKITIYLDTKSSDDEQYNDCFIYDIVLIPADEWSGNFGIPKITGTTVLEYGKGVDIDAITNPRQYRAVQTVFNNMATPKSYDIGDREITADWSRIASSEPIFQANSDQRLWFMQYKQQQGLATYFENCGKVCAQRSARYTLMRGEG